MDIFTINPTWIEKREDTAAKRLQNMRIAHARLISEVQGLRMTNKRQREKINELKMELKQFKDKDPKPNANHFNLAYKAIKETYPHATIAALKSSRRQRELVEIRHAFYFIMRSSTTFSFKVIGKMCGGKDHSSILHGCEVVENVMSYDKNYQARMIKINNRFKQLLSLNGL